MKLTKFFKQQIDKWNEDSKCGYCYEFHAPLTEDALNKQQIKDPCCVQVMLTRDRGEAFRTDRTFNNTIGIVDQQWHYKQFTLYFLLSQQESLNNYDEILGNDIEESKSTFLEDIECCIDDLEFDFCEFIGTDWQLFQWSAFQLINYRDYNYTGYRLSVTIRKRKQF